MRYIFDKTGEKQGNDEDKIQVSSHLCGKERGVYKGL